MDRRLSEQEIALARASMEFALRSGAQKVRVSLNKSLMELFGLLNGQLDKVTHALDRSLQISLFVFYHIFQPYAILRILRITAECFPEAVGKMFCTVFRVIEYNGHYTAIG